MNEIWKDIEGFEGAYGAYQKALISHDVENKYSKAS